MVKAMLLVMIIGQLMVNEAYTIQINMLVEYMATVKNEIPSTFLVLYILNI